MLIDARQKKWVLGIVVLSIAASLVYVWYYARSPRGLTGGSSVGLWYGIVGSLLMVYAGLLSAHRQVPSWWPIGSRATWLKGHVWLGLASGLFILFHSGFRWGGPLEFALWIVLILTLSTGVVGVALQNIVPRLLTRRIALETPYEQIPHLCTLLRRKADALVDEVCGPPAAAASLAEAQYDVRGFYENDLRRFLSVPFRHDSPLSDRLRAGSRFAELRDQATTARGSECIDELERICAERRSLGEQERLHHALHSWLLLHVPLSVLLLVLGVLHAFMSVYY
ncbi:MAG: hypothetical protein P4L84_33710 [Isosphaeraceae bacterium]|nr:hypothetical protein [Isosphaeraceae bacterium]